jgi:hypothetical protein
MSKQKLTYIQRAYDIDELSVQLDAICEDDGKEISDYSQEELVEEAEHRLDVLKDELHDDSFAEYVDYNKKQIKKLEKYIHDFG